MRATLVDGDLPPHLVRDLVRADRIAFELDVPAGSEDHPSSWWCTVVAPTSGPVSIRLRSRAPGLAAVLGCASIVKLSHSARTDLVGLQTGFGIEVRHVMCTRIASELLQPSLPTPAHDLAAVLARWHDQRVPSAIGDTPGGGSARGARLRRSVARLRHLPPLAQTLCHELEQRGLLGSFTAACEYLPTAVALRVAGHGDPLAALEVPTRTG